MALLAAALCVGPADAARPMAARSSGADPTVDVLRRFRALVAAENAHDLDAVGRLVWRSPSTLFVAKTAAPEQGGWAGFWGPQDVLGHFAALYKGTFHMEPDDGKVRAVILTRDVVEVYAPVSISVSFAGQSVTPKPFILVLEWVRTRNGWQMATDVALPVPPRE